MKIRKMHSTLALACAAAVLAGCTSVVSEGVNDAGQAQKVVFPRLGDDAAAQKKAIYPNLDNLRSIGPGVTKDNLYYLLGIPHFSEIHGAREWDYVFKFNDSSKNLPALCQYKIIFDKNMQGQSFHWQPAACAGWLGARHAPTPPPAQTLRLKADALFAFGKYSLHDMRPEGRAELDKLAADLLQRGKTTHVTLTGHTDRIGDPQANRLLSQRRAETVRSYLVDKGLPANHITAQGMGASQPLVQCHQSDRARLIECLAPNRRVDVEVKG